MSRLLVQAKQRVHPTKGTPCPTFCGKQCVFCQTFKVSVVEPDADNMLQPNHLRFIFNFPFDGGSCYCNQTRQVKSSQVKSSQVKSSQVKSSQSLLAPRQLLQADLFGGKPRELKKKSAHLFRFVVKIYSPASATSNDHMQQPPQSNCQSLSK